MLVKVRIAGSDSADAADGVPRVARAKCAEHPRFELTTTELSEVTMYDVKSAIAQAKAVAMNWTEYEQKVREATNDDGPS